MKRKFVFLTASSLAVGCLTLTSIANAQTVTDDNLQVARYTQGLTHPSGIAFLDSSGTALIAEKDTGKIKLMQNRQITATVLDLPVANSGEAGLLSIAISPSFASDHLVYTLATAARADGGAPISQKISQYRWDPTAKTLTLTKKVADLPVPQGEASLVGGKLVFGPDNRLWVTIGSEGRPEQTLNVAGGALNSVGAILHMQADGRRVTNNPFASSSLSAKDPRQFIYAYGIRNSFGIAFDPVSHDLWDTENGPDKFDEINRITPGFNSGWERVSGPLARNDVDTSQLVNLGSRSTYSDPVMSWATPVAPTDIEFLTNNNLGTEYRNDMFVGDVNTGSLYHFDLTSTRKGLQLLGGLSDRVADNTAGDLAAEQSSILFGSGFGVTTDVTSGPGGLYVLSYTKGALYRISGKTFNPGGDAPPMSFVPMSVHSVPEPAAVLMVVPMMLIRNRRQR